MGFALQNRGASFNLDPKHPNVLAGGKRPFHTIIPAFMEKGDEHIGFGIMGGAVQPMAHAQFVSNYVDYGMSLQEALEAPRFFKNNAPGCDVYIESRVPRADAAAIVRARPPDPNRTRIRGDHGTRPGDFAQFEDRDELCGIRSARGWGRDP